MNETVPQVDHVITGLNTGGAELMLRNLLLGTSGQFAHSVVSLSGLGSVGEELVEKGIVVRPLGMRKEIRDLVAVFELVRSWRRSRPNLVQTWLYHADLVGGLAGLVSRVPVIWNIRQSNLEPSVNKASTLRLVWICARLSWYVPARIVCGSEAARATHEERGFCPRKMVVIPNGFDLRAFQPSDTNRQRLRAELRVGENDKLVGRIGRFDPQKDHRNFIRAAARICAACPDVRFVMAGRGMDKGNDELMGWIEESGVRDRISLLGPRSDVAEINAALDIAVSSSRGEGFPNVIGEAMACGVPCVVTDAGDSARIVGETGIVVPPGDPESLAAGCIKLLSLPDGELREMGLRARERIRQRYDLGGAVRLYEDLYADLLTDVRNRRVH